MGDWEKMLEEWNEREERDKKLREEDAANLEKFKVTIEQFYKMMGAATPTKTHTQIKANL